MDTPSTSVSGAMGRSTKKKKETKWKKSTKTFESRSRDSSRTPPTLSKVNSWMSTIDQSNNEEEQNGNRSSPEFYGFDNSNYPYSSNSHYDMISNSSYQNKEEKLIEDELEQYCTISESSDEKISIELGPAMRQRKFSNVIDKDCDTALQNPENENKKELCKYLQLMKPTDKKSVIILQNRRSRRVKNLSKKELDKQQKTSDQENDPIDKIKEKLLDYKAATTYDFPKPPDNIDVVDFDRIADENWFKEWSEEAKKRTAIKRKSNVSVEDIMSVECSEAEKEIFDSNKNRTRSKSRGPTRNRTAIKINSLGKRGRSKSRGSAITKINSIDTSESDEHKSTTKKSVSKMARSKSRNSNRTANSITSQRLNGAQNKNGFNEKAKGIKENDLINIKTRSKNNETKKKLPIDFIQTIDNALKTIIDEPTKVAKRKSKKVFNVKGPGFKIRLSSAKRGRNNNAKTSTKPAPKPRPAKKPQKKSTINESDFDTETNAIQEHINLLKESENPAVIYLSDSSGSEAKPETPIFESQLKSWPRKNQIISNKIDLSSSTTKMICFHEPDAPLNQLNKALERHDSAMQTEPEEKRQFHSQILNIQKTSDEDSEESSGSTPVQFIGYDTKQTAGEEAKWTNTKKQLENQNSISLSTRHGPILKIFYVDFDLVLCQEFLVSFWNQSAPGNVLGAHDMWTSKGSIQRQPMSNNCTLKESLEMVACSYFSLAYIELWTKEHESYQQEVPVTNVYAVVYFWMKQYNGLVKKVLQLENINGFADDVQYSIVKSSPKIVVSWHFTGNEVNRKKTYVHCYQVASDFQSICNVDKFEAVDHYVSSLHNIEGCDTLIMGCGENKITLWNIEGGRLAATIEMTEIKSPLATLWVKCDRGFLFTLQQCVDRELRLIAIHSMNHSWKRLASYKPPLVYDRLKGVCVENGVVLGFYDQGIVCWNAGTEDILVETSGRKETEYISGNYLISVANNEVNVRHAFTSLLKVGYWN